LTVLKKNDAKKSAQQSEGRLPMRNAIRLCAALLTLCAFADAAGAQQFTMKISSPTINDITQEWAKEFAAGLKARVGDKIKVEFYPASQLGQIPATVEGVAMGTIEAVAPASGFLIGLEPRMQVLDAPGLFADMTHAQRVLADPKVRERLATFASSKGIEMIAAWPHGPLHLVSHKPVRTIADFQGQKIRVPGAAPLQIKPFEKLGAQPVSMPLGEVLSAMQNRTIDGMIAAAAVFTAFKYYDVAKGMTVLPGSYLFVPVMVNKDWLKSLGPDLEKVVREEAFNAQRKVEKFGVEDVARTAGGWKKNGGELIVLPETEAKAYLARVESIVPGVVNANPNMKGDFELLSSAAKNASQ
jgi:TRAP-type C4-dicarboxylate transport system substrate-binding protein